MTTPQPKQTRQELAEARRRLAELVAAGSSAADVAKATGWNVRTVQRACREHGVRAQRRRGPSPRRNRIIRALIKGESCSAVAAREGVTRQRVYQIAKEARIDLSTQQGGEDG